MYWVTTVARAGRWSNYLPLSSYEENKEKNYEKERERMT